MPADDGSYAAEARWRRAVMGEAKDALASGDGKAAYEALTRHERAGYPWAPFARSDAGPEVARETRPSHEALRWRMVTDAYRPGDAGRVAAREIERRAPRR